MNRIDINRKHIWSNFVRDCCTYHIVVRHQSRVSSFHISLYANSRPRRGPAALVKGSAKVAPSLADSREFYWHLRSKVKPDMAELATK